MRARGRVASRRAPIRKGGRAPGVAALLEAERRPDLLHRHAGTSPAVFLGYGNNDDASGRRLATRMAIALTDAQVRSLRARFDAHGATPQAHASTWSRRLYAPFFIDAPEMADVKRAILRAHPRHVVAFDIVFESRGNETAWHTDYESLGPFVVRDALVAMRDRHFVSVHFNLTKDGGSLVTCDSTWLSWLTYRCIVAFGIYSTAHMLLTRITAPFLAAFASRAPNAVGAGNAFDNTRLHKVTAGEPRISYVVRLAHEDARISRESVRRGVERSAACAALSFLAETLPDEREHRVGDLDWSGEAREDEREEGRDDGDGDDGDRGGR